MKKHDCTPCSPHPAFARSQYADAPTEAIRRVLVQHVPGLHCPRGTPVPTAHIDNIRMGTTVATNALLEREGAKTALFITKGFRDLLHIGNQSRPSIFDLTAAAPEVLYSTVVEVDERIVVTEVPAGPGAPQGAPTSPQAPAPAATLESPADAALHRLQQVEAQSSVDLSRGFESCPAMVSVAAAVMLARGLPASTEGFLALLTGSHGGSLADALQATHDALQAPSSVDDVASVLNLVSAEDLAALHRQVAQEAPATSMAHLALPAFLWTCAAAGRDVEIPPSWTQRQEPSTDVPAEPVANSPPHPQSTQRPLPVVTGVNGQHFTVRKALDTQPLQERMAQLVAEGYTSAAIVLLHAYAWDEHEKALAAAARAAGFAQVSTSADVMRMVKVVPRGFTTCADAYLTPHITKYVAGFQAGFDDGMRSGKVQVQFMQSDGGLTPVSAFSGHRAILSGPAGGVVGYAVTTRRILRDMAACGVQLPPGLDSATAPAVVGYDMGGTSTDVSRFAGQYEHVFECVTAGVTIQAPQLDISTVAAGGGSRLFFREGMFVVGPESARAHPGPVCYRKGGHLAITDANVHLGRVVPEHFPAIFGPGEDEPLDAEGTAAAFEALREEMAAWTAQHGGEVGTLDDIAYGFVQVANEAMCRPIRELTQMKGHDLSSHILACFGGAGGQHACAMARSLGMRCVVVHRYSGILSALGLALADVVEEAQEPLGQCLGRQTPVSEEGIVTDTDVLTSVGQHLLKLTRSAGDALAKQSFDTAAMHVQAFVNLRFVGTDTALMVPVPVQGGSAAAEGAPAGSAPMASVLGPGFPGLVQVITDFIHMFKHEYGFTFPGRAVVCEDVRVRVTGLSQSAAVTDALSDPGTPPPLPAPIKTHSVFFEGGRVPTPFYMLQELVRGQAVPGPAVIIDATSTLVVEPATVAHIGTGGDILLLLQDVDAAGAEEGAVDTTVDVPCDPIQLGLFSHRFMSIAEQMGRTLQRTSISVNIKERLDFSCALLTPQGDLCAHAPHIPVHLGAMSAAVKFQLQHWTQAGAEGLQPGDVLVSNHPQLAGGSHLPDITVITPVFLHDDVDSGGSDNPIVFFVASRGHHSDIGGIAPGSMPPTSTSLDQEGAVIVACKLVRAGQFREDDILALLRAPGTSGVPGSVGTRNEPDVLSDLRAQVAANNRGVALIRDMVRLAGLHTVHSYMRHIQANAEFSVRTMLKAHAAAVPGSEPTVTLHASDKMDDGSVISLTVTLQRATGDAHFDFTGTSPQVLGNTNAPPAVTASAVIYCLRCMVGRDIPMNQGCLAPVTVTLPPGCLLNPSPTAAVVGGNVLTSQRVTDVVLRAFSAAAASQGCMNNLTFGDATMGYYETIAGGAGAGPTWVGRSGVHTHMTNTRITDPEILERRYPIVLRAFSLRQGSGGSGRHPGGEGVVRALEFRKPLKCSILSERRCFQPWGLKGGGSGAVGMNLLFRAPAPGGESAEPTSVLGVQVWEGGQGGRVVNVGAKSTFDVAAGDVFVLASPGGGGYGSQPDTGAGDAAAATLDRPAPPTAVGSGGSLGQLRAEQASF